MRKIKKILFGITSLTIGGAERVLVDIVNALCNKYDITIFSIYDNGELKKELNSKVKFKAMYRCRYDELSFFEKKVVPIKVFLGSKYIYNKYIANNYDVEIAFLEGPVTRLISNKNSKSKKISWIHSDIRRIFGKNFKAKLKKMIDEKIYAKYDDIVLVSNDNLKSFKSMYKKIPGSKVRVVHNFIDSDRVLEKSEELQNVFGNRNEKIFLSVCRLVQPKAIDRFINVHSKLIQNGYFHKVYIIGDGPEKKYLMNLIEEKNIKDSFILLGQKENPYPYIRETDYFCLLSYFEGFGMVLEESKILNKKIIITDTAARESLDGYENATIINNDEDSIYEGLRDAIKNESKTKKNKYSIDYRLNDVIKVIEDEK